MRVFVTGGTGLVGARLIRKLKRRGDEVVVLSRQSNAWEKVGQDVEVVVGDPTKAGDWQAIAAGCDAVVNLAGTNIFAKRWNAEFKQSIHDSRVQAANNVVAALTKSPTRADGSPRVLVNASAIGFYGPRGDEEISEEAMPGNDFLSQVCVDWENAAKAGESAGLRVVMMRIGIVHDSEGGALSSLMLPFKLGLGGPLGLALSPSQWGAHYWSWIHHADMSGLLLLALDHSEARGPMNATAPHPVTNKEFAKAFGKALGRPAFAPTPALALRLLMGEIADVLTTGQRVIPRKALNLGYRFEYPDIGPALQNLIHREAVAA